MYLYDWRGYLMHLLQINAFLYILIARSLHTAVRVFAGRVSGKEEMVMLEGEKQHICD